MTKNVRTNRNLLIVSACGVLVALFAILLPQIRARYYAIYNYYYNNGETMRDPGQGPTDEDIEFFKQRSVWCPLQVSGIASKTDSYEIVKYSCPFIEDNSDKSGESVKVKILDPQFGEKGFIDLLENKGLSDNPNLHIEFDSDSVR